MVEAPTDSTARSFLTMTTRPSVRFLVQSGRRRQYGGLHGLMGEHMWRRGAVVGDCHRKLCRMRGDISDAIGRAVDLRTAGDLSKYFREEVVTHTRLLHAA